MKIKKRATPINTRNRPRRLQPWSHLPSVAVPLDKRSNVSWLRPELSGLVVFTSWRARFSATQLQFSNTSTYGGGGGGCTA